MTYRQRMRVAAQVAMDCDRHGHPPLEYTMALARERRKDERARRRAK